jgi:hypothetical protein
MLRKSDYVLAALVAAIGAHLGHRWARYIGDAWAKLAQAYGKGLIGEDFLAALPDNPFVVKNSDEAYDVTAILRAYAQKDTGYLDLVLGVPPEDMPVLLTEEAEKALREGALAYLTRKTYMPLEVPGINSPGIVRTPYGCAWRHTTATGRGRFEVESGPGRVEFRLRVLRGGGIGLTALEFYAALVGDRVIANHQVTTLAENRHREVAVDLLEGIARELYGLPNVPWDIAGDVSVLAMELAKLASSISQEG